MGDRQVRRRRPPGEEMDLVIGQPEEPAKAEAEAKEDMKKEVEVAN